MENEIVDGLNRFLLMAEEEDDLFTINDSTRDKLEDCKFSLLGKVLTEKAFNKRAARTTIRLAWGVGEEGKKVGEEIGQRIGELIEVDGRESNEEQGKFLRVRVNVPIAKPLRRGGRILLHNGERVWVDFKYEKLPLFCYYCGKVGHDEKACYNKFQDNQMGQLKEAQYGSWLKAVVMKTKAPVIREKGDTNAVNIGRHQGFGVQQCSTQISRPANVRSRSPAMATTMVDEQGQAENGKATWNVGIGGGQTISQSNPVTNGEFGMTGDCYRPIGGYPKSSHGNMTTSMQRIMDESEEG
ncbi:hypothetical protein L1049_003057 [Liquidambar formosana]|uniref:CCHC-type domain-containing protein n=1 Tax=Liquidambar formosana TaxID=63359 RepID=A0AAP0NGX5_LIQFO